MKKNTWQKILSYFKDVYLESTSSVHNRELHVILSNGSYQLCTSNAVYSYEDKYINFRKSFEWIDWDKLNIKKVLLLGLGLGSVPQMLEKNFRQEFEYTAVEIDEKVIELANKYTLDNLLSPIQFYQADALLYVKMCQEKFDMIIMDVFESEKVPKAFESKDFLDDLANLLNEDGFILYNRLNISEEDHKDTLNYYEAIFSKKFAESSCNPIEGNYMLNSRKGTFSLQNS